MGKLKTLKWQEVAHLFISLARRGETEAPGSPASPSSAAPLLKEVPYFILRWRKDYEDVFHHDPALA